MGPDRRFEIYRQDCIAFGFFWRRHCGFPLTVSLCLPFFGVQVGIGKQEDYP